MLAFVDESGDAGRKILNGSSKYFVVAIVTFADNEDAIACDHRIELLRGELQKPFSFEFHFSENSKTVREQFLKAVAPYPFFYHVFGLNKAPDKLKGPGFDYKGSLYKFAARLTFENAKPYLDNAKVVIDGSGDRNFRNELAVYLRKRVGTEEGRRVIRSVRLQRSSGNNLLQLADYVAGVSNRAICKKPDGIRFRQIYLSTHEVTQRVWPK